jgi:hypothetical protein
MGLTVGKYSDKNNKSLPALYRNDKYITQTDSLIGLMPTDARIDMIYNQIIEAQEDKYGEILLTACDFQTGLFEKYTCKDGGGYKKNFYAVDIARTDLLFEEVMKLDYPKIVIVYGAVHFKWLYADMLDAGFVYKNKKLKFG